MQKPQSRFLVLAFALWLLPLSACGAQPDAEQPTVIQATAIFTATSSPTVEVAMPTEEELLPSPTATEKGMDIDVPDPDPGMANVAGRIFWNDMPVPDLGMLLCEEMDIETGCEGVQYSSRTDENGIYIFANINPGEYSLIAESLDGEHWLFVTAGLDPQAEKYTVAADKTLRIPDQAIYNFDLLTLSPEEDEEVAEARPTLTWALYPDAAYYLVYLTQENGSAILVGEKTKTTSITPEKDLLACGYTWQVEAYSIGGAKIAEQEEYSHFSVIEQPYSCYLKVVTPKKGAKIGGSDILLEWKLHELAAYYRVHILDEDDNDLLEGVRVDIEVAYTVPFYLEPGDYRWYVTAYDADDKQFAQSDFIAFTVIG